MGRYSVRFVGKDNALCNEILFDDHNEAQRTIEGYRDDSFGKFKYIALFDKKKAVVEKLLHFENEQYRTSFCDGDIVRLRDAYCGSGEEKIMYCITNMNESNGRCLIIALNSKPVLGSAETVGIDMLEFVAGKPECSPAKSIIA